MKTYWWFFCCLWLCCNTFTGSGFLHLLGFKGWSSASIVKTSWAIGGKFHFNCSTSTPTVIIKKVSQSHSILIILAWLDRIISLKFAKGFLWWYVCVVNTVVLWKGPMGSAHYLGLKWGWIEIRTINIEYYQVLKGVQIVLTSWAIYAPCTTYGAAA